MDLQKPLRIRNKAHLRYVAGLPCMVCWTKPCQAHHLLTAQPRAMGRKTGDQFVVPLCAPHHRMLHDVTGNERQFFADHGHDDFVDHARALAQSSPSAAVRGAV
jgi:hypothetical protein